MIESLARALAGHTDVRAMKSLLLRTDAASVGARRVLAESIEQEQCLPALAPTMMQAEASA